MNSNNFEAFSAASGFTPMRMGQAKKTLQTQILYKNVVMTRQDFVDCLLKEGLTPRTQQEDKIQQMSRMAFFRADYEQQRAHDQKVKDAGKATVYYVGGYEVGAFGHAYAVHRMELVQAVQATDACV